MNTRYLTAWLPCIVILAILASLVTPSPVQANGEPPPPPGEKGPKTPAATDKLNPPGDNTSYTAEIPAAAPMGRPDGAVDAAAIALSVDAIAQAGAVLVGAGGSILPLASQDTVNVLNAVGDVYFKGSGGPECGAGLCNYDSIAHALTNFSARSGTGMIFATGASSEPNVALNVDGTVGLSKLTGLAWDGTGLKSGQIVNSLTIEHMLKGFTVDGFYIGKGLTVNGNAGTLRLQNLTVTGSGIQVWNHNGNIDLFNVTVDAAITYSANLNNTAGTGNITISNSTFDGGTYKTLVVNTNGFALLNRVEASDNTYWDGADLNVGKGATVKDSRFDRNASGSIGLVITGKGTVTLQNVSAQGNSSDGVYIATANDIKVDGATLTGNAHNGLYVFSSGGNITLNNVLAQDNTLGVVLSNYSLTGPVKTVTVTNSRFIHTTGDSGLIVNSKGSVTLNHIEASNNSYYGVFIDNAQWDAGSSKYKGSGSVSILNTLGTNQFTNNTNKAVDASSKGAITVKGARADHNGLGLFLDSCALDQNTFTVCLGKGNVTLSGVQVENTTANYALNVNAGGSISLDAGSISTNLAGVYLANYLAATAKTVTVTRSSFNNTQFLAPLYVKSKGNITLNNVQALDNQGVFTYTYTPLPEDVSGILLDACIYAGSACTGSGAVSVSSSLGLSQAMNNAQGYGLLIHSKGAVSVSGFSSTYNGGAAYIDNSTGTAVGTNAVKISKSVFDHNTTYGLYVMGRGSVTLNAVSAQHNSHSAGALIKSTSGGATISDSLGPNDFSHNNNYGLYVFNVPGAISLSGVTAVDNGAAGIILDNHFSGTSKPVTVQKVLAENNGGTGLIITSKGSVTLNKVQANANGSYGVNMDNCIWNAGLAKCDGSGSVSILSTLGLNSMNDNKYGLSIKTGGTVLVNGVTASDNTGAFVDPLNSLFSFSGVMIDNTNAPGKTVTVNQGNFNDNAATGLIVHSKGLITLNSVSASRNLTSQGYGTLLTNNYTGITAGVSILSTLGNNQFNWNAKNGMNVGSNGNISLSKVTASDNTGGGASLFTQGTSSISITCSAFNHNTLLGLWLTLGNGNVVLKSMAATGNDGLVQDIFQTAGSTRVISWTVCGH